jgi:hypothetical protein
MDGEHHTFLQDQLIEANRVILLLESIDNGERTTLFPSLGGSVCKCTGNSCVAGMACLSPTRNHSSCIRP